MKNHHRQAKLAALKAVLNGDSDALHRYQERFTPGVFVVQFIDFSDTAAKVVEPIKPTDLVDTYSPDGQEYVRIPYAEFLKNPAKHKNCCFCG